MTILLRWVINALGIFVAAAIVPGIDYGDDAGTLVIVVLVLGLFNAFLKPLLVLFALPFVVLTLGVGILVINALLLLLADNLIGPFQVDGFFSAFLGAVIIGVINMFLGRLVGDPVVHVRQSTRPPPASRGDGSGRTRQDDDVIDI